MYKKISLIFLGLLASIILIIWATNQLVLGAPLVFISTPSTSTPITNFSFTVGTSTSLGTYGSTTLAVYGSTTVQTWLNTLHAFEVFNAASTSIFAIDTINGRASTSRLIISNLGNTGTECMQITNQGIVQTTGTACANVGSINVPSEFTYTQGVGGLYLTPTSTIVGLLTANTSSSTLMRLTTNLSTSTEATTTNFYVSGPTKLNGTFTCSSCVTNADLVNNSVTVTAGTGLSGGGVVSLGSSITINFNTNIPNEFTYTIPPTGSIIGGLYLTPTSTSVGLLTTDTASSTLMRLTANLSTSTQATSSYFSVSTSADFRNASTLLVPVAASSTQVTSGELEIQTKDNTLIYNSGGTSRSVSGTSSITIAIASTTASENYYTFRVPSKFTVTYVFAKTDMPYTAVGTATTVGTTFNIAHGANKNSTTNLFSADQNTTPTGTNTGTSTLTSFCATGCTITNTFNDATFELGEEVWITTSAASSSLNSLSVQIDGTKTP